MATFADEAGIPGRKEDDDGREQHETVHDTRRCIVVRAMADPGLLTPLETDILARVLCGKVTREPGTSKFFAKFSVSVMSRENGRDFAGSLITSILDVFNKRRELLPRRVPGDGDRLHGAAGEAAPLHKWKAFVHFLADLVAAMTAAGWCRLGHKLLWRVIQVALVLCDCWNIMLSYPACDALDEMKCLLSTFAVAGKAAHLVAADYVEKLVALMLDASVSSKFPPEARQVLIDLLEPVFEITTRRNS